jgi:hypothetical protein
MWCLPDINRLNEKAAAQASALKREAVRKRKPKCEVYGCTRRASVSTLWYDIFGDDPKGVLHTCSVHSWDDDPDLFRCENCERVMVDRYTWERYQVELHGDLLCLRCAAQRYFDFPQNWINPNEVKQVVLAQGEELLFDRETGVLNITRCPHVLATQQPLPSGIVFYANAEFDSQNLRQISGDNLSDVIASLNSLFCIVIDGAYQFSFSVGIYARRGENQRAGEVV